MPSPLILLPGMGADARLHARLRTRGPIRALDWPPFKPHWRLADYAAEIVQRAEIAPGALIGGTSMGGMVALEIARQVSVSRVLLISSCNAREQVAKILLRLSPLAPLVPFEVAALTPRVPGLRPHRREVVEMAHRADPSFLRWCFREIAAWRGYHGDRSFIRQIHGSADRVLPVRHQRPDTVVPGAGHLMVMTHARAVSAFIDSVTPLV